MQPWQTKIFTSLQAATELDVKTTASFTILPEIINCKEFVNADEIARGLSPFQPERVSFEAGRIMLNRIDELLKENESFAFETTLSTRS